MVTIFLHSHSMMSIRKTAYSGCSSFRISHCQIMLTGRLTM